MINVIHLCTGNHILLFLYNLHYKIAPTDFCTVGVFVFLPPFLNQRKLIRAY